MRTLQHGHIISYVRVLFEVLCAIFPKIWLISFKRILRAQITVLLIIHGFYMALTKRSIGQSTILASIRKMNVIGSSKIGLILLKLRIQVWISNADWTMYFPYNFLSLTIGPCIKTYIFETCSWWKGSGCYSKITKAPNIEWSETCALANRAWVHFGACAFINRNFSFVWLAPIHCENVHCIDSIRTLQSS